MKNPRNSLEVRRVDEIVFSSEKKWLHPLFDLEDFLAGAKGVRLEELALEDKIIGRGAAFLIVLTGIPRIHAKIMSRLGLEVFQSRGIAVTWETLVDKIDCRTEDLLRAETDPAAARLLLKERAAKA